MKTKKHPQFIIFFTVLAISALFPTLRAVAAENATITGDGVRVRELPSVTSHVYEFLENGTRVGVIEKTDSTYTIDGYAAPWYRILHKGQAGYVFGRYVNLDGEVTVDLIHLNPTEYFNNRVISFVKDGLEKFGKSDSEIIKRLGQPISSKEYDGSIYGSMNEGEVYHSLTYDGISFEMFGPTGQGSIFTINCMSGSYKFSGLRVGNSVADVKRLLGDPEITDYDNDLNPFRIEDGVPIYWDSTIGNTLFYRADSHCVTFRVLNGKVTYISIYIQMTD